MKKLFLLVACSTVFFTTLLAQKTPTFTIEVSTDSILLGNVFKVKFTLENAQGVDFAPPTFTGFNVVGGPSMSSSMSIVNGKVTQQASYTYYLEPKDIGNYYIEPASITVDGAVLETEPLQVLVVPNPDGVQQQVEPQEFNFHRFRSFPDLEEQPRQPKKAEKKRKIYKL